MNSIDKFLNWQKTTWNFELFQLVENSSAINTRSLLIPSFSAG
jgi:hypothetical protein